MSFRCIIVGEQSLPVECADLLLARGHEIAGVITGDAQFREWCTRHSIDCIEPTGDLAAYARTKDFDYLFSIVNGRILPDDLIQQARLGAINFHDGPLPNYAGFNVTTWALINGEITHGITWHGMGSDIDTGATYKQVLFDISDNETAFTLNAKCWDAALGSFGSLIDELASGALVPEPQDLDKRVYVPRFKRPAGLCLLDFTAPAEQLVRLSRGLDFGPYANPMGMMKFWDGSQFVLVTSLAADTESSGMEPGCILSTDQDSVRVATASSDVTLTGLRKMDGSPWRSQTSHLPIFDANRAAQITELHEAASRYEAFWARRLGQAKPLAMDKGLAGNADSSGFQFEPVPVTSSKETSISAFLAQLACASGLTTFDVGFQDESVQARIAEAGVESAFATATPLRVATAFDETFDAFRAKLEKTVEQASARGSYVLDVQFRYPELRKKSAPRYAVGIRIGTPASDLPLPGEVLNLVVSPDGSQVWLASRTHVFSKIEGSLRKGRLLAALSAVSANPLTSIDGIPSMAESERALLLEEWNATTTEFEDLPIHELFNRQVIARPEAIAAAFADQEISYRDLNKQADKLANHLQALGAGSGTVVGIQMNRSIEMMVGLLAILKTGAAYLPLDPTLPQARRQFMLDDTKAAILLTESALAADVEVREGRQTVFVDTDASRIAASPDTPVRAQVATSSPAYVIYTSGSTGQPKGVTLTHRNVANFIAGMDREIGSSTDPGVWLAVTSISFDISVLELFWTLARGFKVVIAADEHRSMVEKSSQESGDKRPVDFSLFYFATNHEPEGASGDKYRLLLDGARYADENGFHAVWTPERHFHAFGGLYPNPSVTSAAIAAITKRVRIHAGSVVVPLHSPIRVAEEWSVVDNISRGRVGISFAAGWHSRDFVLAPNNFADAKNIMFKNIDQVRKLWAGESLEFVDGKGQLTPISILPKPVQKELPTWVTAAGNPETFRMAGEGGYNILTHLLGQKFEDVQKKIQVYRDARKSKGLDPDGGKVTLMLHTFVGETLEEAREGAREPMKNYLKTSVDLIRNSPWSFPAFSNKPGMDDLKTADLSTLSEEEMDALLEFAFERYFETSGLFGTVEQCVEIANKVRALCVDEIACLIDFGVPTDLALNSLKLLNKVREQCQAAIGQPDLSLPAQMDRHAVTHLQCTPSMAKMLVVSDDSRTALRKLKKLMVGGEALPGGLAADLARLVPNGTHNMYGPTETTIWSTTAPVKEGPVTIGRPIANTSIYLLNQAMEPVPVGSVGDLYIGGEGVAQGYWERPELNAERFLSNPFRSNERIYRTGDLARYNWDGSIEFLGRSDTQVKIRGFRIELGEIEAIANTCPGVRTSVVTARAVDDAEPLLVCYWIPDPSQPAAPKTQEMREWIRQRLPEYMTPAVFVEMAEFPLTHNGKIDRKELPAPQTAETVTAEVAEASRPAGELENLIAGIWQQSLNRSAIGVDDNFFDLGGHSILAVQVSTKLGQALDQKISLMEMFRFPTIRSLAKRLSGGETEVTSDAAQSRAKLRLEMQANRGQLRRGTRRSA